MYILPYNMGSASAKALAGELGLVRIKKEGSRFRGNADKVVINWGNSEVSEEVSKCNIINKPEAVALASNKLKFFQQVTNYNNFIDPYEERVVPIPAFSTDKSDAAVWLSDGSIVVERHKLTGNSGEGIRVVERVEDLQDAPLYVLYIPKKQEYRVHVAGGQVVDLQRKARRHDVPDDQVNWRVRNHDNGFIFQRNDLVVPGSVKRSAVAAIKACGLDFGAVDIIYNERRGSAYVLEINTAPGLTGQTLEGYVARFKSWEVSPVEVVIGAEARAVVSGSPMFF